jgi:sugar transferase (PEP-CTERM system associated)
MIRVCSQYTSLRAMVYALFEGLLVAATPWFAARIRFWSSAELFDSYTHNAQFVIQSGVFAAIFLASLGLNGLYDLRKTNTWVQALGRLLQAFGVACLVLSASYYIESRQLIGRGVFLLAVFLAIALVGCSRILGAALWRMAAPAENTLILGTRSLAIELALAFDGRKDLTTRLVGFIGVGERGQEPGNLLGYPVLGSLDDLEDVVRARSIRRVVVAIEDRRGVLPIRELVKLKMEGIQVEEGQSVIAGLTGHVRLQALQPSWLVFSDGFRRSRLTLFLKRVADLVLGISGFIVASPVMALAALAIKLDSRGAILYRQQRVGYKGRMFNILKFRSMCEDAESNGAQWALVDDPRVTRVGRILRRFRIDEFPQFINVIRGDMSFVGPRPERPVFVEQLRAATLYYDQRHSVRPGITGWAQVQYRYGASVEDALVKLEYDLFYLQNLSMLFDLVIIFKTVRTVLISGEQGLPFTPIEASATRLPNASEPGRPKSASVGA